MKLFLLRYGELALKGKNRKAFEDLLIRNIRDALQGISAEVRRTYGRLFVHLHEENREREVLERLGRIFGLVSISPVDSAPLNMEDIQARALATIQKGAAAPFTFKVETRRSNKAFPLESPEISRITGAHILSNVAGSKVDVHHPDIILHMEIREKEAYVYHLSYPGCGGLPVGASGRALLLLSGGIDSPVAGWMGMKRGLEIEALHFHSFPFTSERAKDKVLQIASMMARYSGKLILHVAGFTGIQEAIHKECPPAMRITIMRRMMFRVAERLAASRGPEHLSPAKVWAGGQPDAGKHCRNRCAC